MNDCLLVWWPSITHEVGYVSGIIGSKFFLRVSHISWALLDVSMIGNWDWNTCSRKRPRARSSWANLSVAFITQAYTTDQNFLPFEMNQHNPSINDNQGLKNKEIHDRLRIVHCINIGFSTMTDRMGKWGIYGARKLERQLMKYVVFIQTKEVIEKEYICKDALRKQMCNAIS